jgi:hypothetical protein
VAVTVHVTEPSLVNESRAATAYYKLDVDAGWQNAPAKCNKDSGTDSIGHNLILFSQCSAT